MARPKVMAIPAQYRPREELIERLRRAACPVTMLETLRRQWPYPQQGGLHLVACEICRVHRAGAKGFVIEYQLRLSGADGERVEAVFGELFPEDGKARFKQLVERSNKSRGEQVSRSASADLVWYVSDPGLVLRSLGLDDRIDGLRLLRKPSAMKSVLLQHVVPAGVRVSGVNPEVLRHRLGKRCIVRVRFKERGSDAGKSARGSVVAKFYNDRTDRGRQVFEAMGRLWSDGLGGRAQDRVSEPIAYLPEWRAVLMEDVPGTPLSLLDGERRIVGTAAAGRALAKLHRCRHPVSGHHTVDDEIAMLAGWVGLIGDVYPELGAEAAAALGTVRNALDGCRDFEPALVHRDYYEKQVLIDGTHAVLIDFDTLCQGDPALDVGNFLAQQKLAELKGAASSERLEEAFLAGYGEALSADVVRRIEGYSKSTLLRLACLYSLRSPWTHIVNPLLEAIHAFPRLR